MSLAERRHYQQRAAKLTAGSTAGLDDSASETASERPASALDGDAMESDSDRASLASVKTNTTSVRNPLLKPRISVATPTPASSVEMLGLFKREHACLACEEAISRGELAKCKGVCQNAFHIQCLKEKERRSEDFRYSSVSPYIKGWKER